MIKTIGNNVTLHSIRTSRGYRNNDYTTVKQKMNY